MKKIKTKSALLCVVLCMSFLLTQGVFAADTLTGETASSRKVTQLYTGVTQTYVSTPSGSAYGSQKINIVEFDLAQRDLYFDVVYGKGTANGLEKTQTTAENFTKETDKTAIAAVNGDLWMVTYAHARVEGSGTSYGGCSDAVVKKSLTVSRGFNISDGEIYTTAHMTQETPYEGEFWSFGVTDDFVPLMGNPYATVTIKDTTTGSSTTADGINRLPANNALVMYTDKVMGSLNEFALDDAYEIVIEFSADYKICHGTNITGKVVGIYDSNTAENPGKISDKQIVLTARGSRVSKINSYKVGDSINITVSIGDKEGNSEGWQRVTNAVGGHIQFVVNGVPTGAGPGSGYPTTIVGYTKEKKMMFITVDGRGANGSTGTSASVLAQLAKDLGLYNAFIVDGGGSTTMVVSADGTNYKVVNTPSDSGATPRSVVNSIIVSHGPQRAAQGEFEVVLPEDLDIDPTKLTFTSKAYVDTCITGKNEASASYSDNCAVLKAETAGGSDDPYVSIPYNSFSKTLSADDYKYLVFTYMLPTSNKGSSNSAQLFLCPTSSPNPSEANSKRATLVKNGKFNSATVDLSTASYWKGTVFQIRFDFFINSPDGDLMYLYSFCFAKTKAEAQALASAMAAEANGTEDTTTKAPETSAPATSVPDTTAPAPDTTAEPTADTNAAPATDPETSIGTGTSADTLPDTGTEPPRTAEETDTAAAPSDDSTQTGDITTDGESSKGGNWVLPAILITVIVLAAVVLVVFLLKKKPTVK